MDKVIQSARAAVADIRSGSTLAVGGFGLCGVPWVLINALFETGVDDLEDRRVLHPHRVSSPAKPTEIFNCPDGPAEYVLEHAIVADYRLVRAWKGDRHGSLVFRRAACNFNPLAGMCGLVTIAEVEELVEPGELDPDHIHLPGVYVRRVVHLTEAQANDKRIEKRTTRPAA